MFKDKLSALNLEKSVQLALPSKIVEKVNACLGEDAAYAADELVELSEEILSHVAAVGFQLYLQGGPQKEVFNDFLLQLFTSSSHTYNAGPLYRWAAHMIQESTEVRHSGRFRFFGK